MKEMQFTTRELEVLKWALNNYRHEIMAQNRKNGKPMENETTKIMCGMCGRAFNLMYEAHKEESESA